MDLRIVPILELEINGFNSSMRGRLGKLRITGSVVVRGAGRLLEFICLKWFLKISKDSSEELSASCCFFLFVIMDEVIYIISLAFIELTSSENISNLAFFSL